MVNQYHFLSFLNKDCNKNFMLLKRKKIKTKIQKEQIISNSQNLFHKHYN